MSNKEFLDLLVISGKIQDYYREITSDDIEVKIEDFYKWLDKLKFCADDILKMYLCMKDMTVREFEWVYGYIKFLTTLFMDDDNRHAISDSVELGIDIFMQEKVEEMNNTVYTENLGKKININGQILTYMRGGEGNALMNDKGAFIYQGIQTISQDRNGRIAVNAKDEDIIYRLLFR